MSDVQEAFWVGLTDQRVANLWDAADLLADMPEHSRKLLLDVKKGPVEFLLNADPSTIAFLRKASEDQIDNLNDGLKLIVSLRLVARIVKAGLITMCGALISVLLVWEKVQSWLKTR